MDNRAVVCILVTAVSPERPTRITAGAATTPADLDHHAAVKRSPGPIRTPTSRQITRATLGGDAGAAVPHAGARLSQDMLKPGTSVVVEGYPSTQTPTRCGPNGSLQRQDRRTALTRRACCRDAI